MSEHELVTYLHKRMDRFEEKLDKLMTFRAMLWGGAAVISTMISLAVAIYFGR